MKKIGHPLFGIWKSMIARCNNPWHGSYYNYGGRGITVCKRWMSFDNFVVDMPGYRKGLSIDRIDNNSGYRPDNCRWATRKEQALNRRNTRFVSINGINYLAADLASKSGLHSDTIMERAKHCNSLDELLDKTRRPSKPPPQSVGTKAAAEKQRNRTHCKHGHLFDEANTRISLEGWRECRTCGAEYQKRLRDKLKAKFPTS